MQQYITHKRFKGECISGKVNIPAYTELTEMNGVLFLGEKAVCSVWSENAHQYFSVNSDGNGMLRGQLTQAIQKALKKPTHANVFTVKLIDDRWDEVWENKLCTKYKRADHEDYWLWNHDFFNAPIADLQYISKLIGAKP